MKLLVIMLILLSLTFLVAPIIWLEIGKEGYKYYGPDVPHVYILGGTILGKDRSWWGINFAYKFQLFFILLYAGLSIKMFYNLMKKKQIISFCIFNFTLLILFPFWIETYHSHVINNSDGADLTTHLHIGMIIYIVLLVLNSMLMIRLLTSRTDR